MREDEDRNAVPTTATRSKNKTDMCIGLDPICLESDGEFSTLPALMIASRLDHDRYGIHDAM
jgi:hypothetical protein